MKQSVPEREQQDRPYFLFILPLGIALMLVVGQIALGFAPYWSVSASMDSSLNPNAAYIRASSAGEVEPLLPVILTPPAWQDTFLTPQADPTGTAAGSASTDPGATSEASANRHSGPTATPTTSTEEHVLRRITPTPSPTAAAATTLTLPATATSTPVTPATATPTLTLPAAATPALTLPPPSTPTATPTSKPRRKKTATPTPSSATAPSAPEGLAAEPAKGKGVLLSWSPPASDGGYPVTGYNVYRATASGEEVFLRSVKNVTSFKDSSTTQGQAYYYIVRAVNAAGEGPPSSEGTAVAK
jgi:hypothetical protein